MGHQAVQPWQDEDGPTCERCRESGPFGMLVVDLPAALMWPGLTRDMNPVEGWLCWACIEVLREDARQHDKAVREHAQQQDRAFREAQKGRVPGAPWETGREGPPEGYPGGGACC